VTVFPGSDPRRNLRHGPRFNPDTTLAEYFGVAGQRHPGDLLVSFLCVLLSSRTTYLSPPNLAARPDDRIYRRTYIYFEYQFKTKSFRFNNNHNAFHRIVSQTANFEVPANISGNAAIIADSD
jgi:hypothetical protein